MNFDKLFLKSLNDLHLSINSGDEYKVLCASGIIRKLLVDGGRLVDQVNRDHKLKIKFRVIPPNFQSIQGVPEPHMWCMVDSIDPRRSPEKNAITELINIDKFLGLTIGRVDEHKYTVKNIIEFAANVAGAVHYRSPEGKLEEAINELRKFHIFSDINVLLQHLRSIGRIILEGLRPLRNKILGLERFQGAHGLSFYMALTLFPTDEQEDLFILDIGDHKYKDRLSIYLDVYQELCFRIIDSSGKRQILKAGAHGCAFNFGKASCLVFQVAFLEREILLYLDSGGWSMVKTVPRSKMSLDPDKLHFVLGSDVMGKAKTHMSIMELCVYSRISREQESEELKAYFESKIQRGYESSVYFQGNKFLHSKNHPNFMVDSDMGSDGN